MENAQSLVVAQTQNSNQPVQPYFPTESDWKMMLSFGASALRSGMLPSSIQNSEAAAIIALKGRELGIPFMIAFAHIHVISGKPSMSAEMMQALARRNLPGLMINILESTDERASVEFIRPEKGAKPYTLTFTMEMAKKAELANKTVWKQYPASMLWSRAVSAGLRKVCPEALMGISYTPEELGAEVDKEGNVVETTGRTLNAVSAMNSAINAFEDKIKSKIKEQNEGPALLDPNPLPDNQPTPLERGDLVKAIFDLKPVFKEKFPQAIFKVLLNNRYQVNDTPLMSVEQLSDLLQFMQGEISGNQKPAIQTATEKSNWYKTRTNQGELLQDERYVK